MKNLIGNVYLNLMTNHYWKLTATDSKLLTFSDRQGNSFKTVPSLTANYMYVGNQFPNNKRNNKIMEVING